MSSRHNCCGKIDIIKEHIRSYPDFPKEGVTFRDFGGILETPSVFSILRDVLVNTVKQIAPDVECIAALDARGFLIGPIVALDLQIPFIPIRKKGKLPGNVTSEAYVLEYGEDVLQVQTDSVKNGLKIVIVDDLLATGGSLEASCRLIKRCGGIVLACLVVVEIQELDGVSKVSVPVHSIVKF